LVSSNVALGDNWLEYSLTALNEVPKENSLLKKEPQCAQIGSNTERSSEGDVNSDTMTQTS